VVRQAYGPEQLWVRLPLFFETWSDPAWQTSLQRAIRYYADAAVMGTLQRNIVLPQVALEALEVLWHCLTNAVRYDEALHVANRNRVLAAITAQAA
jgi:hypothetical protein